MAYHQSPIRGLPLAEVLKADRQVESGHYVRHEDMKTWLLSWGTERELPPPKRACGERHERMKLVAECLSQRPTSDDQRL